MSQKPILHALSVAIGVTDTAPDAELLRRFAEADDRTAFELVVRRHAGLVWDVCRAVLPHDSHAAEDTFQATFLALARKASSVRDASAAGWLFRVARNAAVRARARAAKRETAPLPETLAADSLAPEEEAARQEVAPVVAEEVDRLAAKLREPVVLCLFEGHTHAEAAERLGWPVGTVASCLARAKDLLRDRLTRRGVALPAAGLSAIFATVPAVTAARVQTALALATGPASGISPTVLSLTQGVLSTMRYTKLKLAAALVLLAAALSVAVAAMPNREPLPPKNVPDKPAEAPKPVVDEKAELEKQLKPFQGKWRIMSDAMSVMVIPADPFRINDIERLARTQIVVEKDKMVIEEGRMEANPVTTVLQFPKDGGPQAVDLATSDDPKETNVPNLPAIYKIEGDTLTLCIRLEEHIKKGRPTEFKADKTQVIEVLERVKDEKAERKVFAGEWTGKRYILGEGDFEPDKTAKPKWTFDGAEVVMSGTNEPCEKATVKLDTSATPPTIELTITQGKGKGTKLVGIYSRQENKLTVCFRDPKRKGTPPPAVLAPDIDGFYYILERAPKK